MDEYNKKLGYPQSDIDDLQTIGTLKLWAKDEPIRNIQLSQSHTEILADIKKVYSSFTEHPIMKFLFEPGGWLQKRVSVSSKNANSYTSIFDEGKSDEFYLGRELDTFSTTGCAASGGATLASAASVSSRDAGVPGDPGALAMPVVEEPLKTAKRAPKKIRFDVDARYPSIAEDAAGGESAA